MVGELLKSNTIINNLQGLSSFPVKSCRSINKSIQLIVSIYSCLVWIYSSFLYDRTVFLDVCLCVLLRCPFNYALYLQGLDAFTCFGAQRHHLSRGLPIIRLPAGTQHVICLANLTHFLHGAASFLCRPTHCRQKVHLVLTVQTQSSRLGLQLFYFTKVISVV